MTERQWSLPAPGRMGPPPPPPSSAPFSPESLRPTYREPHRVAAAPLLAGLGATLVWFALFGGLGRDLVSYAWWTCVAALTAWAVALVLTVLGDRGVATGIALAAGFGLSVAAGFVAVRWITTSDWPMW